jgi:YHS domain-containing protein
MKSQIAIAGMFVNGSFVLLSLLFGSIAAGTPPEAELAIKGYDTVAYFTEGKALKGSDAFTADWHGMVWHFSTRDNRDLFAASPEKYAPQYDGWCAWAMTESRLAVTDPEVWKIVDGKLYLNCSREAYEKWSRDIPGHIKKADAIWKEKFGGK